MKKINIVFIMPELNIGGSERVITNIMNSLDREVFSIRLILFRDDGMLVDEIASDIKIYNLNIYSVKKGIFKLIKKLQQLKPDIVFGGIGHLNISMAVFIPFLRRVLPNTKFVARQSNILTINNKQEKYPSIHEWLYKRVYSNYDKVICQSKYMQQDLVTNYNFPIEKTEVIYNPIDINRVTTLYKMPVKYPFGEGSINLINVGQFRYQKRHDLLIKAFAKLDKKYTLTLIGDGDKRAEIEELVKKLNIMDRVAFLGHQKNPYAYLKKADLFVLTSEFEGFPNVVLEANLCGLPVVAFETIGVNDEVIREGVNGILVPFDDIKKLYSAIRDIKIEEFNKSKMQEIIKEKYSITSIIKNYQKLLKDRL
jgi:glycosyltransferase involved in cell wall biosynthesis